jgi:hypothetical protein
MPLCLFTTPLRLRSFRGAWGEVSKVLVLRGVGLLPIWESFGTGYSSPVKVFFVGEDLVNDFVITLDSSLEGRFFCSQL